MTQNHHQLSTVFYLLLPLLSFCFPSLSSHFRYSGFLEYNQGSLDRVLSSISKIRCQLGFWLVTRGISCTESEELPLCCRRAVCSRQGLRLRPCRWSPSHRCSVFAWLVLLLSSGCGLDLILRWKMDRYLQGLAQKVWRVVIVPSSKWQSIRVQTWSAD